MLNKLFKKTTPDDLIEELKNKSFNESKVDSMLKQLDINYKNQNLENFLHLIVPENRIESVKWLIKNRINPNEVDGFGRTALIIASKFGYLDSVEELIKVTKEIELCDYEGYSAIEYAILNNHFSVYKKLKPYIKNLNKKNNKGNTLLHLAIKAHNYKVVDDLYADENFDFNKDILFYKNSYSKPEILHTILSKFENFNYVDKNNRNILFYLVLNGKKCEDVFYRLLNYGLDINHTDNFGNNLLFHLIYFVIDKKKENELKKDEPKESFEDLIDFIPILIEKGIDTTISNNEDETVLSLCAKNKSIDILGVLLECDININLQNSKFETALNSIIIKGNSFNETIHLLIDYGANPNIADITKVNPIEKLIEACLIIKDFKKVKTSVKSQLDLRSDYFTLFQTLLINTNANLRMLNSKGEPYFFEALRYGNLEMVKLLIKYGADINQTDLNGENILYKYMRENQKFKKEAQLKEYHNNLQAIIMMGANVNAKDSHGGITLHKAILDADLPVIKMLLHGGVDINAIDNSGRTIIHNTIWKNDIKIFKLIYAYNKNLLNEPDKYGVLPINYAAFLGYTDLVLEIIELNGQINNPHPKTKYILNFLKKFHKNLKTLIENARTKEQKNKLLMLVNNMKKEFLVD